MWVNKNLELIVARTRNSGWSVCLFFNLGDCNVDKNANIVIVTHCHVTLIFPNEQKKSYNV